MWSAMQKNDELASAQNEVTSRKADVHAIRGNDWETIGEIKNSLRKVTTFK